MLASKDCFQLGNVFSKLPGYAWTFNALIVIKLDSRKRISLE
jgi:hypothetical protein